MKKPAEKKHRARPAAEELAIGKLKSDPQQIRRHTDRNLAMIGDGLKAVGAARSIVVDETNTILAGNGTIEAARQHGFTKVRVIETDGSEIIAVRRRGLTKKQKVELALYDNRSGDFAEYDASSLTRVTELVGVDAAVFFSARERAALAKGEPGGLTPAAVNAVERWAVLVFLPNEGDQQTFIARMQKEGKECRALMS